MLSKPFSRRFLEKAARSVGLIPTASANFASDVATPKADNSVEKRSGKLQFSKQPIMKNFGELEFGEIPEPLKYAREFKETTISNGIRVCTESSNSPLAGVAVYIKAGSRNENLDTSGSAYLL